jgi:hypothetical protein
MKFTLKSASLSLMVSLFIVLACEVEAEGIACAPKVLMDTRGAALAVWENKTSTHSVIQAAVYTSKEGWSLATDISDVGVESFAPDIAMNTSGDAVVIWTAVNEDNSQLNLFARERPSGGSWSSIINVLTASNDIMDSRLGRYDLCYKIILSNNGDITVIWTAKDGPTIYSIHGVTAKFGGDWNPPVQLSP